MIDESSFHNGPGAKEFERFSKSAITWATNLAREWIILRPPSHVELIWISTSSTT